MATQFRPPPNPEEVQRTRQYEELRDWVGDILPSPLDESGSLWVRQVFAFTVSMADYPITARGFADTKAGDNAVENRKLLLWLFCYLCDAFRIRTSYPRLQSSGLDASDDDKEDPSSGEEGYGSSEDESDGSASSTSRKRKKKHKKKKKKHKRTPEEEVAREQSRVERVRSKLQRQMHFAVAREEALRGECERFDIDIQDILEVDDVSMRAQAMADRLKLEISREDEDAPQHWCAIEYVPDNTFDGKEQEYAVDIFDQEDPFRIYNKLSAPWRPCNWTFIFATTSRANLTSELSVLLSRNLLASFRLPEATVDLSLSQKCALQQAMSQNVAGSDANIQKAMELIEGRTSMKANKRKREQGNNSASAALKAVNNAARAATPAFGGGNKEPVRYSWRGYEQVTPKQLAKMASVYLDMPVEQLYSERGWCHTAVCSMDSPLDANNLFSQAVAVSRRALRASETQSLMYYGRNRHVYYKPNKAHASKDAEKRGLYKWTPPQPGRLLWFDPASMNPATVAHRNFPDRRSLDSNVFYDLYPKLRKCTVSVLTGEAELPGDEVASDDIRPSEPIPMCVAGVSYADADVLSSKIESTTKALQLVVRQPHTMRTYETRVQRGELFGEAELDDARAELARYSEQLDIYTGWCKAHASVMAGFASVSRQFAEDYVRYSKLGPLPDGRTAELSAGALYATPRAPFILSQYLKEADTGASDYEIFNVLRSKNETLYDQIRPILEDRENGLSPLQRCCLYKIYQRALVQQWNLMARSSVAKLPEASRNTYAFIEEHNIYAVENRPTLFRKINQDMGMLSNVLASLLLHYQNTLKAARPELVLLAMISSLDASRNEYNIHLNVLLAGPAGQSKSFTLVMMCLLRILGTYREVTGQTDASNRTNIGAKLNHMVEVRHEMDSDFFFGQGQDRTGNCEVKQKLDRQQVVTQAAHWNSKSGNVTNLTRVVESVGIICGCTNLTTDGLHGSMSDRMIVVNIPPGEMILTAMLAEHLKLAESQKDYKMQIYTHRWLQAIIHEIWTMIGLCIVPQPNTTLLFILMHFINDRMATAGIRPFRPREILKMKLCACILMLIDVVTRNFLVAGGRFVDKPVTPETLVALGPEMYITSSQAIQTVLTFAPYFTMEGEDQLRTVLKEQTERKKMMMGSAAACYAPLEPIPGAAPYRRQGGNVPFVAPNQSAPNRPNHAPAPIYASPTQVNWNRQQFNFVGDELMHLVRAKPGAEKLTKSSLDKTIRHLTERTILASPYVRDEGAEETSDPYPCVKIRGEHCPCWERPEGFCKKHTTTRIPVIMRTTNGHSEGLAVSTAWLMQKVNTSPMTVITEALKSFFDHRYQPSIKCSGSHSTTHPGTFDVFEIKAPEPHADDRPILCVPNIHRISVPEFEFMHNKSKVDAMLDAPFWVAHHFQITQPYDLFASLERADAMFMTSEKVTERDLVNTMYTVGHKMGLVDRQSPLFGFELDPEDPKLARYDDKEDLDLPSHENLVPSADDPSAKLPMWEEMDMPFEQFKRTAFTPECQETRLALFEMLNEAPLDYNYPEDLRIVDKAESGETVSKVPLSSRLHTSSTEIEGLKEAQMGLRLKRTALQRTLRVRAGGQADEVKAYLSPPPSPMLSPMSPGYSDGSASPGYGPYTPRGSDSPRADSLVPGNFRTLMRSKILPPSRGSSPFRTPVSRGASPYYSPVV